MKNLNNTCDVFAQRRKQLRDLILQSYSHVEHGVILLFAQLESDKYVFRQESIFYYFTGITEPGVVLCINLDGREDLYVPVYGGKRAQWVTQTLSDKEFFTKDLGEPCVGYSLKPFFRREEYENLINDLDMFCDQKSFLFGITSHENEHHFFPVYRFENVLRSLGAAPREVIDISAIVGKLRRQKDEVEVEVLRQAINVTQEAHAMVMSIIKPGIFEFELQAEIEKVFTKMGAMRPAFPSIIAAGKNTTVLHYVDRNRKIEAGDLVVVDIGAEFNYYCADLTRTYPASRIFSDRQKEVYEEVLNVQEFVRNHAKQGMFLNNNDAPDHSLHHLAVEFLKERGYSQYFVHGIGHWLGLDVHDMGDVKIPLALGDVFTIEPGIYIPEENIGVRIEDDFVITQTGCSCLSDQLIKKVCDIENALK